MSVRQGYGGRGLITRYCTAARPQTLPSIPTTTLARPPGRSSSVDSLLRSKLLCDRSASLCTGGAVRHGAAQVLHMQTAEVQLAATMNHRCDGHWAASNQAKAIQFDYPTTCHYVLWFQVSVNHVIGTKESKSFKNWGIIRSLMGLSWQD